MHHHVDHTVGKQVLGLLETFRQLLADGLFNDTRPGEADQRTGFGDVYVAKHGVRGGDPARCGIGQNNDVGLTCFLQFLHGDGGARHLHQRQDALLHARTARGGKQNEWATFFHGGVEASDDGLARGHAERAAHEIEILNRQHHAKTVEPAVAELYRVVHSGFVARVLEPIGVAALVAKAQRVGRHFRNGNVEPGLVVEHRLQTHGRAHAHVIVGARDDKLVGFDVLVEHKLAGLRTFDPEIFRHLAPQHPADFRTYDVGDPVHVVALDLNGGFFLRVYTASCRDATRFTDCFKHLALLLWNVGQSLLVCFVAFLTDVGRRYQYSKRQVILDARWAFAGVGSVGVGAGRLRPASKGRYGAARARRAKRRHRGSRRNRPSRTAGAARAARSTGPAKSDHSRGALGLSGRILLDHVPRRRSAGERLLRPIAKSRHFSRRAPGNMWYRRDCGQ